MHESLPRSIIHSMYERRHQLGFSFVLVFTFSLVLLSALGLTPEPQEESDLASRYTVAEASTPYAAQVHPAPEDAMPLRVVIESVGIDVRVQSPASRDIAVLDEALLTGAVHYPGSGTLTDTSNMFIFGHSSHLPAVNNPYFKAFNDLEKVREGDTVRVESRDTVNVYRVSSIRLKRAQEALIELSERSRRLTLSTCNSFGQPTDRFVVEAEFVGSFKLVRPTASIDT